MVRATSQEAPRPHAGKLVSTRVSFSPVLFHLWLTTSHSFSPVFFNLWITTSHSISLVLFHLWIIRNILWHKKAAILYDNQTGTFQYIKHSVGQWCKASPDLINFNSAIMTCKHLMTWITIWWTNRKPQAGDMALMPELEIPLHVRKVTIWLTYRKLPTGDTALIRETKIGNTWIWLSLCGHIVITS